MRRWIALAVGMVCATASVAQDADKTFRLSIPDSLTETGFPQYLLPRFSLKTGTRIERVGPEDAADASFGDTGRAAFADANQVWSMEVGDDPDAKAFAEWLFSAVGRNTIDSFTVDGDTPFSSTVKEERQVVELSFDGDVSKGADLSLALCGRCHVVSEANRMKAIGSTPSFKVLRALPDWGDRFQAFYALNPHPAFTQIADVTPPFDISRPSPIAPVEMTLDDLDHILAFVAAETPADLGAPIESR